jgi:hypothetical protein
MDITKVVYAEFHDASLCAVNVDAPSRVRFDLDVMTIYCATAKPEVFEVWRTKAQLTCYGVTNFQLRGPLPVDAWISDAFLSDAAGRDIKINPNDASIDIETIRLVIGASEIVVSATSAKLELLAVQSRENDWVGPLKRTSP